MSQSPYANLGNELIEPLPQRTSVMAIISLVLGIISIVPLFCLFPASGALAVILGGTAILLINRSGGRLSGTGMAATGIVLGLIVTVLQIVGFMMATRGAQMFTTTVMAPVGDSLTALEKGDFATARKLFTPTADAAITDAELTAFVKGYQESAGNFKEVPNSLMGLGRAYIKLGQSMQAAQGRNDMIPIAGEFSKGTALVMIMVDPAASQSGQAGNPAAGTFAIPVRNIGVITADGKATWIIDPASMPAMPMPGTTFPIPPPPPPPAQLPPGQTPPSDGSDPAPSAPDPTSPPPERPADPD